MFCVSNFRGMMPFRLVGVFPSEQEIWEWRWDSARIDFRVHPWEERHWFSSSLSDERAERLRGATCRAACYRLHAGSVRWLRRLHASHVGGPFSLCVHREDVKTLSYTEVIVKSRRVSMCNFRGTPCMMSPADSVEIEIERAQNPVVRSVGCSAI